MSPLEIFAVITGILTLVWLVKNNIWNWPIGIISSLAFAFLFFDLKLYADVTLQIFFVATGFLGWWQWAHGGRNDTELPITTLSTQQGIVTFIGLVIACLVSGYLFDTYTDASLPYVDSVVTGMSIVAQILLMRRKLENWYIWIVMDFVAIGLYFYKGIYLTTGLYVLYLVMSILGAIAWSKIFRTQAISPVTEKLNVVDGIEFRDMDYQSDEAKRQGVCHTRSECEAFYNTLSPEMKQPAIEALREEFSESEVDIEEYQRSDYFHLGMGMAIRNFLRHEGFGETYFGVHNLDDIYSYLVDEATGKK